MAQDIFFLTIKNYLKLHSLIIRHIVPFSLSMLHSYQNQKEINPNNQILLNENTEELLGDFSDGLKYLEKTANLSQLGQFSRDLKAQSNVEINQTPSEETKLTPDDEQIIQEITWEWQSPMDHEPGKWSLYNRSDTYLLEKAYLNKEENVDLGEWIVYVSDNHMFQQRKDDISKQTRVRRNNNKEEYIKRNRRMRRFIEGEKPKTYTNVFGSLGDYLSFFENRTPEMASFGELFRKAEDAQDIDKLNKEIVPIVIKCIKKEASKAGSEKNDEKKLVRLFRKIFKSFEQFYGDIIKAYTMETFLYLHLNRYLRNEDWTELNDLLPYAFCFCKAFLCPQISSNCNKHLQQSQNKPENDTENLILYRGARFEEVLLSFYDPKIVSNFSWNAVTSTSTNRCTAEFFINTSSDLEKVPVLFEIEVPLSTVDNLVNVNLLDIKTLSAIPEENEIVLAPGSVFELIDFTRDNNGAKVKLKLVIDTNLLVDQGKILHGAMHTQVSTGKVAKIIAQQGKELAEALYHLRGNLMIEEIEFTFCKFDERTLKDATEILLSLPNLVRVGLFTVISNKQTHLSTILKTLGNLRIKSIEISDRCLDKREQLLMLVREMRHLESLTSLQMDFTLFENLDESMMKILCSEGLRSLTSLTNLSLTFSKCKFTDKELKSLSSEGIRALTSLTSLTLDFSFCIEVTDEGIESLTCEGLKHLTSLTNLKLAFRMCGLITDKGLKSLSSEGIRALNSLTSLTLDFSWCKGITDEGVRSLTCEGVRSLTSLTSLNLDFQYCEKITNEGVNILGSHGIRYLASPRNLSLNFSSCSGITNKGEGLSSLDGKMWPHVNDCWMKNLFSQHLVSLTFLTLNLEWHHYIGEQEIAILCSTGLRHMTLLETLDLNFSGIHLGDHEMEILCLEGLRHLVSLTTLTLNFDGCYEITDTGVAILCSDVLTHTTSLKTLTLDFTKCFQITDDGMNLLRTQAASLKLSLVLYHEDANTEDKIFNLQRNLNSKFSRKSIEKVEPSLSFKDALIIDSNSKMSCLYTDISEKGDLQLIKSLTINSTFLEKSLVGEIEKFYSEGLRCLGALKTLILDFGGSDHITDRNMEILCSQGLRYLTSLTVLTLNFSNCEKITDEAVKSLCSEGFRHLTSLTTLDLDFCRCPRITDNGMKFLCSEGLAYLTSVTDLTISFGGLDQITDEIVKSLGSGLTHLTSLTTLHLGFLFCKQITGEGVKALCSEGLRHLNSLSKLTLDLSGCEKITDEEVKNFCSGGLRYIDSILDLTLEFGTCQISDEGLRSLCSEGLKYLTSITALNLNFDECTKITAKGAKSLFSSGLRYLTSLTTLELSFKGCEGITDVGVHNMCLEGFKHLTSLTKLLLNFDYCENMTDKGVKSLCSEGLRYLIALQSITLSFKQCTQITDQGIKELCSEGLTHLTSLANLNLDFRYCYKISHACLEDLRKLLKYFRFN